MEVIIIAVLGLAALTAVARPYFRTGNAADPFGDGPADASPEARAAVREDLESEILRYRQALRAGTVCVRCGRANPGESRYCAECGRSLGDPRLAAASPASHGR